MLKNNMVVNFFCDFNPFFTSSALANRYEGLLKGLMHENVTINLFILGGYNSIEEIRKRHCYINSPFLKITYLVHTLNSTLFLRRVNNYILGRLVSRICDYKLRKAFQLPADYCWIAGGNNIRKSFLKYQLWIKAPKSIIEFSEFQQLYKNDATLPTFKIERLEQEYRVTCDVIKSVDCILVMTKRLEHYYKSLSKSHTNFLHLPMTVDLSRFQHISIANKYRKPYIAFTGTYSNAKDGVDILIKAFAKIASKYPNYNLLLAGFYHYDVSKQKELIAQLGLNDKISYLGTLDKEQIPELVCNASLLVLPRPDSHQAQGGFPTKLGEYLATGKNVCVTKVGEIPDYLEDNFSAFMATPGDVDSFADAMDRALSDSEKAKQVGRSGRKVAENNFNIDVQAKRLVRFLKDNQNIGH